MRGSYNMIEKQGDTMKLLEMFEKIIKNNAIRLNENISLNGKTFRTYEVLNSTEKEIKNALEEKMYFLIPPCVEHFLYCYEEAAEVSLKNVMNGSADAIVQSIARIRDYIKEEHMNEVWENTRKEIVSCINELRFQLRPELYADSYAMCQIMIDASEFVKKLESAKKIKSGNTGQAGTVKLMTRICKYDHLEDFIEMLHLENLPEKYIIFGTYYPRNKDTKSRLYEYVNGYPEERIRNVMEYEHLSQEEAEEQLNPSKAAILIGIKNGENIWIQKIENWDIVNSGSFFGYYNTYKRKSYLPYQLFFDPESYVGQPVEADKNYPAIKFAGWSMQDIMDEEQAVWVVGLYQLLLHSDFFADNLKIEDVLIPGCMIRIDAPDHNASFPQLYCHDAPEMDKCISGKERWLLTYCGVDIKKLPFELCEPRFSGDTTEFYSPEEYAESINSNARWLIRSTLEKCFAKVYEEEQDMLADRIQEQVSNSIDWDNMEKYFSFMAFFCNHSELYNALELSKPAETSWRGDTTIGVYEMSKNCFNRRIVIETQNGKSLKRPSVIMIIEPRTVKDWSVLFGIPENELPVPLRYWEYAPRDFKIKEKHKRIWIYGAKKDLKELLHFDNETIKEIRKIV